MSQEAIHIGAVLQPAFDERPIRVIRPLVAHNMLLGARFLLEHEDYRKAAEFGVSQKNDVCYARAFDLYMLIGDLQMAKAVVDLAAAGQEWSTDRWEARRALLRRLALPLPRPTA